jgi:large subunit ribosomal protein L3
MPALPSDAEVAAIAAEQEAGAIEAEAQEAAAAEAAAHEAAADEAPTSDDGDKPTADDSKES